MSNSSNIMETQYSTDGSSALANLHRFSLNHLRDWQREFWRKLSEDAANRNAFPSYDFDQNGYLKPWVRQYHSLYRWIAGTRDSAKYDTLIPMWEHTGNGVWRLIFIEGEQYLEVMPNADVKDLQARRKQPGRGGVYVQGVAPANQIGDDWDMVQSDDLSTNGDALEDDDENDKPSAHLFL